MRIALTGASGIVGRFVLSAAKTAGHYVTQLDRTTGYQLGDAVDLSGHDALIHCAFAHEPGKYRGGEGDDPARFVRLNRDGTFILFDAAVQGKLSRIVFLSSRAVHDGYSPGTVLTDDLPARPDNFYGQIKADAEGYLATLAIESTAIRATGVYGPGAANKWRSLFADYLAGHFLTPRVATEVHGCDLARAVLLLLNAECMPRLVNCSDLVLDRHDLLTLVKAQTGCPHLPPDHADPAGLRIQTCKRLHELGWQPGGMKRLVATLPSLLG